MADYSIEIKRSAAREIDAISNTKQRRQVVSRIARLANDPRPQGSQKLSGKEAYRIRQGSYRVIYTIEVDRLVVVVVKVGPRRDVYR